MPRVLKDRTRVVCERWRGTFDLFLRANSVFEPQAHLFDVFGDIVLLIEML